MRALVLCAAAGLAAAMLAGDAGAQQPAQPAPPAPVVREAPAPAVTVEKQVTRKTRVTRRARKARRLAVHLRRERHDFEAIANGWRAFPLRGPHHYFYTGPVRRCAPCAATW
jgi:hypothetical protein